MSRLIDADRLIEIIKNIQNHMREVNERPVPVDAREIFTLFIEITNGQLTAYDLDKVVRELEEESYDYLDYHDERVYTIDLEDAIEIVKRGEK